MKPFVARIGDIDQAAELISTSLPGMDHYDIELRPLEQGPLDIEYRGVLDDRILRDDASDVGPANGSTLPVLDAAWQRYRPRLHIPGIGPSRSLSFLVPLSREGFRFNGRTVKRGSLLMLGPGQEVDFVTPSNTEFINWHLEPATATEILRAAEIAEDLDNLPSRILTPPTSRLLALVSAVKEWLAEPDEQTTSVARDDVLACLLDTLAGGGERDVSVETKRTTRIRAAKLARDYLEAMPHRSVSKAELCSVTGTSLRTLETGFREHFGAPPYAWHRVYRLIKSRHALMEADSSTKGVSDVALAHGFSHLGRFSVEYRARFGESPSETLINKNGATARQAGQSLAERGGTQGASSGQRFIQ